MSTVESVLALISVASLLLAVWSRYQAARDKDRQTAAVAVISERVDSAAISLEGAFAAVNSVVQIPKTRATSVDELQDAARVARSQLLACAKILRASGELLALWKGGMLLNAIVSDEPVTSSESRPDIDRVTE